MNLPHRVDVIFCISGFGILNESQNFVSRIIATKNRFGSPRRETNLAAMLAISAEEEYIVFYDQTVSWNLTKVSIVDYLSQFVF
ncbi:hypothetical protein ES705_48983 [subsurface metagenome]